MFKHAVLHILRASALAFFLLVPLVVQSPAFAQDKPAVSSPNGQIAFSGGDLDGHEIGLVAGSYALPLSHRLGFQIDGLAAAALDDISAGLGGHLFWRDAHKGLFGLYSAVLERGWPNIDYIGNVGVEGEYYGPNWTFSALAGFEFGDRDEPFFLGVLSWYPETEDLHIYAGFGEQIGLEMAHFGFEYNPKWQNAKNTTLFLNSIYAGCDEHLIHLGVRFHFGPAKSLKSRHREDRSFMSAMPGNLLNLDSCGHGAAIGGGGGGQIGL